MSGKEGDKISVVDLDGRNFPEERGEVFRGDAVVADRQAEATGFSMAMGEKPDQNLRDGVFEVVESIEIDVSGVDNIDPDDPSSDFTPGQPEAGSSVDVRPYNLRSLGIEVDGRTVSEHIRPLNDFFDHLAISHTDARRVLRDCLSELDEDAFNYPKFLAKIGPANFYSSNKIRGGRRLTGREDVVSYLRSALGMKWQKDGAIFLKFLLIFPSLRLPGGKIMRKGSEDIALQFPRILDLNQGLKDLGLDIDISPQQALALQAMFSLQSNVTLRNGKDHRKAYFLAQLAVLVANAACAKDQPGEEGDLVYPSLSLIERFRRNPDQARSFVRARLSLLLPDKNSCKGGLVDQKGGMKKIVQEDFITADLIEFTKALDLYQEFEPIFKALKYYRQMQFMRSFHMVRRPYDPMRKSVLQVLEEFKSKNSCKAVVADFGGGNGLLAKMLHEKGLVERIVSVDKHDGERVEEVCYDGAVRVVKLKDHGLQGKYSRLRDEVIAELCQADIVIAGDSLHESDVPFAYIQELYEKVLKPGGVLYINDPSHCQDLDGITKVTLHPYDSTRHPSSMLSWEQYLKILSYLSVKGARITGVGVDPGSLAGYNDVLWRLSLALEKPAHDGEVPYKIQEAEGFDSKSVQKPEDIFGVWPISLIPEEGSWREKFLRLIHPVRPGIGFAEVRRFVITRLLTIPPYTNGDVEREGLRRKLSRTWSKCKAGWYVMRRAIFDRPIYRDFIDNGRLQPYHDDLRDLLMELGLADGELLKLNSRGGEAIAIQRLLLEKLDLDVKASMKDSPGWQGPLQF